jgi:hypothetical protein
MNITLQRRTTLMVCVLLLGLSLLLLSACGGEQHQQAKARPLPEEEFKALPPGEYHS